MQSEVLILFCCGKITLKIKINKNVKMAEVAYSKFTSAFLASRFSFSLNHRAAQVNIMWQMFLLITTR